MVSKPTRVFLGLVAFSLAGSLLSRITHLDPGPIKPIASALTILSGVWATYRNYLTSPAQFARFGLVFLFGAAAEVIGLATGYPFGRYQYTNAWSPTIPLPQIGPFPLLLPWAWLMMAGAAYFVVADRLASRWVSIVLGALIATLIDLLMEPVMTGPLRYWIWDPRGPLPGGAPVLNSIGWFGVSLVAAAILGKAPHKHDGLAVLAGFSVLLAGLAVLSL